MIACMAIFNNAEATVLVMLLQEGGSKTQSEVKIPFLNKAIFVEICPLYFISCTFVLMNISLFLTYFSVLQTKCIINK